MYVDELHYEKLDVKGNMNDIEAKIESEVKFVAHAHDENCDCNRGGDMFPKKEKITTSNATVVTSNNDVQLANDVPEISQLSKDIQDSMSFDKAHFLMPKDVRALKASRYDKIASNFAEAFVIKNNKTGQIVELRAANAFHAANLIGWRPRHVTLVDVVDTSKEKDVAPTTENNVAEVNGQAVKTDDTSTPTA